ncbi:MAG: ribosome-associated translation inhibitor RaiA [Bacilli bacterium]
MKFQYVCKDVELTSAMKKACEDKLGRFEHYFHSEEEVVGVMRIEIVKGSKFVEATISADNFSMRAKTINDDFYNAVDVLAEKLEGQMRKAKTQLKKATKQNSLRENIMLEQISDDLEDEANFEIVKKKTLSLTPMDADEALARMDALGHNFFIYLDSTTGLVNVLYERENNGYGVIEIEK